MIKIPKKFIIANANLNGDGIGRNKPRIKGDVYTYAYIMHKTSFEYNSSLKDLRLDLPLFYIKRFILYKDIIVIEWMTI